MAESQLSMVHRLSTDFTELFSAVYEAPRYHIALEVLLLLWVLWLLLNRKTSRPRANKALSENEKENLVLEWTPEPLVPIATSNIDGEDEDTLVDGCAGKFARINGHDCLNFASLNFLNMVGNDQVAEKVERAVMKYGVGSCGPRGFYGTFDIHVEFEEKLASFLGCEEAVLYSYGFCTVASVIPAYSKRSDLIFADEMVSYAIQKGIVASKSEVKYFRHNDVGHLESLLNTQLEEDVRNPVKAKSMRRFLIIEGLYLNTGLIAPLDQYVRLRDRYKVRIIIDESVSIGVLGERGTGILEHFGLSIDDVDVISGSLELSFGSIGGFSAGSSYVVDHQRLSSLGYCFSASLPPLLTAAALEVLNQIENGNGKLQQTLKLKSIYLHEKLQSSHHYHLKGESFSPVKHLSLVHCNSKDRLDKIIKFALGRNVLLTRPRYLSDDVGCQEPSIRVSVNVDMDFEQLDKLANVLVDATNILDSTMNGIL